MIALATLLADRWPATLRQLPPVISTIPIKDLTLDSRAVTIGTAFVALPGQQQHGLDHAAAAVANGAAVILAEADERWPLARIHQLNQQVGGAAVIALPGLRDQLGQLAAQCYGNPGAELRIVGVTGTNGKTSVSHWIAQLQAPRCGIIGTLGYGLPGAVVSPGLTTPDAIRLQAMLAHLRQQGATQVAMEVSSHALAQGRADAVPFTTAVLTNLTRDHLDYHGDLANYAAAKLRLFQRPGLQQAVLNADDPFAQQIDAALEPTVTRIWYSLNPAFTPPPALIGNPHWLHATALSPQPAGIELHLDGSFGSGTVTVGVIGQFNAANLLAAVATVAAAGVPLDQILKAAAQINGVAGRMEQITTAAAAEPLVIVDYAHTPDGLAAALRAIRWHGQQRRVVTVCGCGGNRDVGKRPLMGGIAAQFSDLVILTDDNPRHEDGGAIIADMQAGMTQFTTPVLVERDRAAAIRRAIQWATADDVVLIAGKGHETTQDYGTWTQPFSDRDTAAQALAEWQHNEQ
ncbi:UDP-N-acetylmuramoyl-L-alanyl-D-glutamate--2,6-diaminopimelate ligase [Thiospirillum jenense]|uniref:UDP-N-acetylmuramoyl-L-alanyl-D-glutamate--2,6-diaminopimelate ligase n=1 Tax=Thiospirillum jenense TaxID=1653858 RepID=A0A839HH19_9GAMM|nr:UDP-N-acetylmuramoyl-L-alanyl-D-glutamate--2,6-diaminopimelate ligase [Thiospirillum jenense]MBB1126169.1 UDP-N-acetylmuramoyl-L-alanyl-D-glutamate--2,6-diaminopimelate ligase [Thiospirillum jenense]